MKEAACPGCRDEQATDRRIALNLALQDARSCFQEPHSEQRLIVVDLKVPEPKSSEEDVYQGGHPAWFKYFADSGHAKRPAQRIHDSICRGRQEGATEFEVIIADEKGKHASQALGKFAAEFALGKPLALVSVAILTLGDDIACQRCDKRKFWARRWVIKTKAVNDTRQNGICC